MDVSAGRPSTPEEGSLVVKMSNIVGARHQPGERSFKSTKKRSTLIFLWIARGTSILRIQIKIELKRLAGSRIV